MSDDLGTIQEKFELIDGLNICYARTGHGKNVILFLPGMLGTWRTDFLPQLSDFDSDRFTMIAWDPPGYGKSRPHERTAGVKMFHEDAHRAHRLMQQLNLIPYSIVGWSHGALTGLFIAHQNPSSVEKLVMWGAGAFNTDTERALDLKVRNIKDWHRRLQKMLETWCSLDYAQRLMDRLTEEFSLYRWGNYAAAFTCCFREFARDRNVCRHILPDIHTPTLVIKAEKDTISPQHPVFFVKSMPNARMITCNRAGHDLHLQYPQWFKEHVQNFLLQSSHSKL